VPPNGYPIALYLYSSSGTGQGWSAPLRLPALGSDAAPLSLEILAPGQWWVGSGGDLWTTADGGANWSKARLPGVIESIDFVNRSDGMSVVAGPVAPGALAQQTTLLTTGDGGAHWQALTLPSAS
jgi:photosystem II stability/assembly factor-like uncharacterized protein